LLLCQLLASELAGLAAALHLLLQVGRFLLQAKQDVLTLLVLADAVLQLVQAQGQPLCALVRVLGLPLLMQWMRFKARREGLLFFNEVLMLHTQFLDLRFHCAEFIAQLIQCFFKPVYGLTGVGFFPFIVAGQAVQQGFGLVVGVFVAAAYRAGLIVLQLFAQLFNAGATGQALALQ